MAYFEGVCSDGTRCCAHTQQNEMQTIFKSQMEGDTA